MLKRLALAVSISAFAAGAAHAADVVVSSKIDTEGTLLGNVIALALEANGIKTKDRIALGATPVVRKAITAGEIDIYPEYTGTIAKEILKLDSVPPLPELNAALASRDLAVGHRDEVGESLHEGGEGERVRAARRETVRERPRVP